MSPDPTAEWMQNVLRDIDNEVLTRQRDAQIDAIPKSSQSVGPVARLLGTARQHSDLTSVSDSSHRAWLGSGIGALKKNLRRLLTPVTAKQAVYNAAMVAAVEVLANEVERLSARVAEADTTRTQASPPASRIE